MKQNLYSIKKLSIFSLLMLMGMTSFAQNEISLLSSPLIVTTPSIFDVERPSSILLEEEEPPKNEKEQEIGNAFFLDGLVGVHGDGRRLGGWGRDYNGFAISLGIRFGHKWYLGQIKKWNFGVQGTFIRVGNSFGLPYVHDNGALQTAAVSLHVAPSAGFINAFDFGKITLEANLNLGFNLLVSFVSTHEINNPSNRSDATMIQPGFMVNPCVKVHFGKFVLGIDAAILYGAPGRYRWKDNNGNHSQYYSTGVTTLTIVSVSLGTLF